MATLSLRFVKTDGTVVGGFCMSVAAATTVTKISGASAVVPTGAARAFLTTDTNCRVATGAAPDPTTGTPTALKPGQHTTIPVAAGQVVAVVAGLGKQIVADPTSFPNGIDFTAGETAVSAQGLFDVGAIPTLKARVTITGPITSFGPAKAGFRLLYFVGAGTILASAIATPGAADLVVATGDAMIAFSDSGPTWRCLFVRSSGKAVIGPASGDITDATALGRALLTAVSAAAARSSLSAAASGSNADITALTALTALVLSAFAGPASISRTAQAGVSLQALTLANPATTTIGNGVILDLAPNAAGPGVRSAQIEAQDTTGGNTAALLFRVANGAAPAEAARFTPAGAFVPSADAVRSFGSSSLRWLAGWVKDLILNPGIGTAKTPTVVGDLVIETTSNTALTFRVKGSDGTVRSGTVTLA